MSGLRLHTLEPGSFVRLGFKNQEEIALFLGVTGNGPDRRARFVQPTTSGTRAYQWEAYRSAGRWVYGSSADRLTLLEVIT